MPHMESARQGASWGLLGNAQLLNHFVAGGPTKLSHAGLGWAGQLAQAGLRQIHSGKGPQGGSGRTRQHPWPGRVSGLRQGDKATHLPFICICQKVIKNPNFGLPSICLVTPGQCASVSPRQVGITCTACFMGS